MRTERMALAHRHTSVLIRVSRRVRFLLPSFHHHKGKHNSRLENNNNAKLSADLCHFPRTKAASCRLGQSTKRKTQLNPGGWGPRSVGKVTQAHPSRAVTQHAEACYICTTPAGPGTRRVSLAAIPRPRKDLLRGGSQQKKRTAFIRHLWRCRKLRQLDHCT